MISQLVRSYFAKLRGIKAFRSIKPILTHFALVKPFKTHIYESYAKKNVNTTLVKNFVDIVITKKNRVPSYAFALILLSSYEIPEELMNYPICIKDPCQWLTRYDDL